MEKESSSPKTDNIKFITKSKKLLEKYLNGINGQPHLQATKARIRELFAAVSAFEQNPESMLEETRKDLWEKITVVLGLPRNEEDMVFRCGTYDKTLRSLAE